MSNTNEQLQKFYSFIEAEEMFDLKFEDLNDEQTNLLSSVLDTYNEFFKHNYVFSMPLKAINDKLTVEDVVDFGHKLHSDVWNDVQKLKTEMDFSDLDLKYTYTFDENDVWETVNDDCEELEEYLYSIYDGFEMDEGLIEYYCNWDRIQHHIAHDLKKELTDVWNDSQLIIEFTEKLMMDYYKHCEETYGEGKGDYYCARPSYDVSRDIYSKLMQIELVCNKTPVKLPSRNYLDEYRIGKTDEVVDLTPEEQAKQDAQMAAFFAAWAEHDKEVVISDVQ